MCKRIVARGGWRLRRWGRGDIRLVRAWMKRRSCRGEEIKGSRGVEATLVTVRFMVSHDSAEGQELVLQWDKVTKERALAKVKVRRTASVAFSVGVDTSKHHSRVHHMTVNILRNTAT